MKQELRYSITLFFFSLITTLPAQAFQWAGFSSGVETKPGTIAVVPDGHVFYSSTAVGFLGCWPDPCPFSVDLGANTSAYVVQYAASGTQTAIKAFPAEVNYRNTAIDLQPAPDNGVYLLYHKFHFAEIFSEVILVRMDANLNIMWQTVVTTDVRDKPHAITADELGNVFVVYSAKTSFYDGTLHCRKYNANGQLAWTQTGEVRNYDFFQFVGLETTSTGDMAFLLRSSGYFTLGNLVFSGDNMHHILGVLNGATGLQVSSVDLFTETTNWFFRLEGFSVDAAGGYFLSFRTQAPVILQGQTITHSPAMPGGGYWAGLAVLGADFSLKNVITLGSTLSSDVVVVSDIKRDVHGNICAGGYQSKPGPDEMVINQVAVPLESDRSKNFVVKFDSSGNYIWSQHWGSAGFVPVGSENLQERVSSIALSPEGHIYVHGVSKADSTFIAGQTFWNYKTASFVVCFGAIDQVMRGNVWFDLNNNGIQDTDDPPFSYALLGSSTNQLYGFSNQNGAFNLAGGPNISNIQVKNIPDLFSSDPPQRAVQFTNPEGEIIDALDFRLVPQQVFTDLRTAVTPLTPLRPGFAARWQIHVQNAGVTTENMIAKVVLPPYTNFVSSEPPGVFSGDTLVWQFPPTIGQNGHTIILNGTVATTAPLNNDVQLWASINLPASDIAPDNNSETTHQIFTGAYDPNDKLSSPSGQVQADLQPELLNRPVEYTIRFQNTGSDTAFRVVILDTIAAFFDLSSIQITDYSHPVTLRLTGDRTVAFQFKDILLPDSNTNLLKSHGFVRFSIRPVVPFEVGDVITNRAGIYFDYNAPVITNEAQFEIVLSVGVQTTVDEIPLTIFPNPATDRIFISINGDFPEGTQLILANHISTIRQQKLAQSTVPLTVSDVPAGAYTLMLIAPDGKRLGSRKVVIIRQ
jgi:hypothetical protein